MLKSMADLHDLTNMIVLSFFFFLVVHLLTSPKRNALWNCIFVDIAVMFRVIKHHVNLTQF